MGTDISGDLSEAQLVAAHNEITPIFSGEIPGYFNGRRARYTLESGVSNQGSFIYLSAVCYGNLEDFFESEKLQYWKKYYARCQPGVLLQDDMARVFPYHGIVMVNDQFYFLRKGAKRKRIWKTLEKFGYAIEAKKDTAYSHRWCHETKRELLKAIRRKGVVDPRIRQIVAVIRENIGADAYTFAHYRPRAKLNLTFDEYQHIEDPKHQEVMRVFELTEDRLEDFQGFYTYDLSTFGVQPAIITAAGIASPVRIRWQKRHIPMIDFKDRIGLEHTEFALDKLGMPGMIVDSGNSYHFYGFETLSEGEWRDFIETTRNLPFVDKNWPDLQLEQGYSMLRITPAYHRLFQPCIVEPYKPAAGDSKGEELRRAA